MNQTPGRVSEGAVVQSAQKLSGTSSTQHTLPTHESPAALIPGALSLKERLWKVGGNWDSNSHQQ